MTRTLLQGFKPKRCANSYPARTVRIRENEQGICTKENLHYLQGRGLIEKKAFFRPTKRGGEAGIEFSLHI